MFKNRDNIRVMEESDGYYFLTNRRNILSIMSSGLLGPSDIFAKYKNDILTRTGGYFPLFSKGFSNDLINATTEYLHSYQVNMLILEVIPDQNYLQLAPNNYGHDYTLHTFPF